MRVGAEFVFYFLLIGLSACSEPKRDVNIEKVDYYSLGMKEYKKGNYQDAIRIFNQAHERDNDRLYFYKGLSYEQLKKYDSSIISFGEAIRCKPENGRYYMFRGHLYRKIGDPQKALQDYGTAIKKSEKVAFEAYFNSAKLKLETNNKTGACEDLKVIFGQGFERADSIYNVNCK